MLIVDLNLSNIQTPSCKQDQDKKVEAEIRFSDYQCIGIMLVFYGIHIHYILRFSF